MGSNDQFLKLLCRVLALEIIVQKFIPTECLNSGISPRVILTDAEAIKTQMEALLDGDASAVFVAAVDNLYNGIVERMRHIQD